MSKSMTVDNQLIFIWRLGTLWYYYRNIKMQNEKEGNLKRFMKKCRFLAYMYANKKYNKDIFQIEFNEFYRICFIQNLQCPYNLIHNNQLIFTINYNYLMIILNIFKIDKINIRKFRQEFQQNSQISAISVIVKSKHQQIYSKVISYNRLLDTNLCPAIIPSRGDGNVKIIDLQDHQIDASEEADEKHYINELFNTFLFFLTTGYLESSENQLIDLLYLSILMEIPQLTKGLKQIKMKNESSKNKLWSIILLIINHQKENYYKLLIQLFQKNPNFLIDIKNQRQINHNFLNIKSLKHLQKFLMLLYKQFNKNQNSKELNRKYNHLIEVLAKHYIASHQLSNSLLETCLKQIFQFYSMSMQQNLLKENEQLIAEIKAGISEKNKVLEKQKSILSSKIDQLSKKITTKKKNIQDLRIYNPLVQIYVKFDQNVVHHQSFQYCRQKKGIRFDCGHFNCIDCLVNYAYNLSQHLFIQKQLTNRKIFCMYKQGQKSCEKILSQFQFKILLELGNAKNK